MMWRFEWIYVVFFVFYEKLRFDIKNLNIRYGAWRTPYDLIFVLALEI